jgi:mono/diheme cytochrome c family protein
MVARIIVLFLILNGFLFLTACGQAVESIVQSVSGMEPGGGMMGRHHANIPAEYAGLVNPIEANDESLVRGESVYVLQCATCHGDGGMGDGPAGAALDPVPAPVAHSGQMMGDDYLFWRISEGGKPFQTAMPAYKGTLDETERWNVINYLRALGSGRMVPQEVMGGQAYDPEFEARQHEQMLSEALEQQLLTQEQADTFTRVHDAMDELRAEAVPSGVGMEQMQDELLDDLVGNGKITEAEANTFRTVHTALLEAGLMQ